MKTIKEQLEVMHAYAAGKTIKRTSYLYEYSSKFSRDFKPRNFNWHDYDYEIVEPIVKYMVISKLGNIMYCCESYDGAKETLKHLASSDGYRIIEVVENLDFIGDEE
jgi:hypothetical protein